jgi:TrmH family RNA methyltransferase
LIPNVTFTSEVEHGLAGELVTTTSGVLDKASYRTRSEGLIAVFDQFSTTLDGVVPSPSPFLLLAEGIEKPGNLGAMMRTAAAAGVDGLITVGGSVDVFNPNALRASTGALFTVPLAMSSWDEVTPWLGERGMRLIGASPDARLAMWSADLTGPLAVVIGAEADGLSDRARSACDELVVIPQEDAGVDSLNASVAAGVLLFEVVRQRNR